MRSKECSTFIGWTFTLDLTIVKEMHIIIKVCIGIRFRAQSPSLFVLHSMITTKTPNDYCLYTFPEYSGLRTSTVLEYSYSDCSGVRSFRLIVWKFTVVVSLPVARYETKRSRRSLHNQQYLFVHTANLPTKGLDRPTNLQTV
jgi:hypothetical protein